MAYGPSQTSNVYGVEIYFGRWIVLRFFNYLRHSDSHAARPQASLCKVIKLCSAICDNESPVVKRAISLNFIPELLQNLPMCGHNDDSCNRRIKSPDYEES